MTATRKTILEVELSKYFELYSLQKVLSVAALGLTDF
jgi:hypothetical protein